MTRVGNVVQFGRDFGTRAAMDLLLQKITRPPVHHVRIRDIATPVRFRPGTIDLTVMRQIFTLRECIVELEKDPLVIIDGGANVGYSSLLFANVYPAAKIFAVEPDTANCGLFAQNCASYEQITLIRGAIWPRRETLEILNEGVRADAFQVGPVRNSSASAVQAYTVHDLMARADGRPIDILKLDIEGAEKELFEGEVEWLDNVRVLMVELHDRFKPGCTGSVQAAVESRTRRIETSGEYTIFFLR